MKIEQISNVRTTVVDQISNEFEWLLRHGNECL